MLENIKLFATDTDRSTYEEGDNYTEPYVSLVDGDNAIHYNKPPFFCKLTLSDDSVVEIEGSGELTQTMVSPYSSTIISAEIGKLCTIIGGGAFSNCSGLTNITIPSSVTTISGGAFAFTSLQSIILSSNVIALGGGSFHNCSNLISVTIEAINPPEIIQGYKMFEGNAVGRKIYVPSGSVNAYKTATHWSDYAADIEPIPTT